MAFKADRSTCIFILLLISVTRQTNAKEILCLLGVGTETALIWNKVLLTELAAKGHDLTVVTPFTWNFEPETSIDFIHLENANRFLEQRNENSNLTQNDLEQSTWKLIVNWYDRHMATCRGNLESIGFSEALNLALKAKRSFDLIVYDVTYGPGCLLHMAHLFQRIPIVGITGSSLSADILNINQNSVLNPALDPFTLSDFGNNMNYWKRLYNTALYGFDYVYRQWVVKPVIEGLWSHNQHAKIINVPKSLHELMPRFKVILTNHHPLLHTVAILPTNIIPVPGLHIQTNSSSKLPTALSKFIENSKLGIILIDLHSNQLSENHVETILEVIRKYPKYGFIWYTSIGKIQNVSKSKPNNLFIEIRSEILELFGSSKVFNKIKFVLTVPEILRIQECLYNGLPMITLTLRPEQKYLAKRIEEQGFALNLQLRNYDANTLATVFEKSLNDKNLLNNAVKLQKSFRNQQNPSLETAVWWVENLLKNPQVNDHLISANRNSLGVFARNSFDIFLLFEILILMCVINMALVYRQTIKNFREMSKAKRKVAGKMEEKLKKLKKDKKEKVKISYLVNKRK